MGILSMTFQSKYLNDKQRETAKEFIQKHSRPNIYLEEDCCGTTDFHFVIQPSGIGDEVYIVCGKERLWLDDGLDP